MRSKRALGRKEAVVTEEETGGNDRRGIAGIGMTKSGENDTLRDTTSLLRATLVFCL